MHHNPCNIEKKVPHCLRIHHISSKLTSYSHLIFDSREGVLIRRGLLTGGCSLERGALIKKKSKSIYNRQSLKYKGPLCLDNAITIYISRVL